MAVGGLFSLIDSIIKGELRNGFALVRPPGHHAENHRAMGFCLFNNIALAARRVLSFEGINRVAVVDWDLHHGNGTQNCFYEDPGVLFISTHQYPHYPGTGSVMEVGSGPGEGYTINVPLPAGAGDADYIMVFHDLVLPVLESYKPDFILVSAGFDTHLNDPLGGMRVTESGYVAMIKMLMSAASKACSDKLALTLEGGYDLSALRESVKNIILEMSSYDSSREACPERPSDDELAPVFRARIPDILDVHRKYWPNIPERNE
jgi:acetoin utilization deacetylase AcuC-like enzyme